MHANVCDPTQVCAVQLIVADERNDGKKHRMLIRNSDFETKGVA